MNMYRYLLYLLIICSGLINNYFFSFSGNNNQNKNIPEQYLSNYYIIIPPLVHSYNIKDYNQDDYYLLIVQWILEIKEILHYILKNENKTENKIYIQKYLNLFQEFFIHMIYLKQLYKNEHFYLNTKIYGLVKGKIFPIIKKINKLFKKTKDRFSITHMYHLKKYIFSKLLKSRPLFLNNYCINKNIISYGVNEKNYLKIINNYKDFLFVLRSFILSVLENNSDKIVPNDYKQLQIIGSELLKLTEKLNNAIIQTNLENLNIQNYYDEINDLIIKINTIFYKTENISTYKVLETFSLKIYNYNNCLEYIGGYYQSSEKSYYQLLIPNNNYYFLNKYKLNITNDNDYQNLTFIENILETVYKNDNDPKVKNQVNQILEEINDYKKEYNIFSNNNQNENQLVSINSNEIKSYPTNSSQNITTQYETSGDYQYQVASGTQKSLATSTAKFSQIVTQVNSVLSMTTLSIDLFYDNIYKDFMLHPIVDGQLKDYYIEHTDAETNMMFLDSLIESVDNTSLKNELNNVLKFFKNTYINIVYNNQVRFNILQQIKLLENSIFILAKNNKPFVNYNDNGLKKYINYVNIQLKKINNISLEIKNKFPSEVNINNINSFQDVLRNLDKNQLILLEKNGIIFFNFYQFQEINEMFNKYEIFITINENNFDKLIGINYKLNELISYINLAVQNFFQFAFDYNDFSKFYNQLKTPLLKKR